MSTAEALRDLASRQHGVVSRAQLTDIGFSRQAVGRAVASGRLERISPRVLRVGGTRITSEHRAIAAALDAAGAVALQSAAALWGRPGYTLHPIHVISTRRPHRNARHVGIMHSSTTLTSGDVTFVRGIPVTNPRRTLYDLAGRIDDRRLFDLFDQMLSDRLISVSALHALGERLPAVGGTPGMRALGRLILSRPVGYRPADSNLERRFEWILGKAGDAPFERQVDVGDDDGWIGRVDHLDRRLRVIVEVQSARFHAGQLDRERDAIRLARLRRAGWIVIEVTDEEVWSRPDVVIQRVRDARSTARRTLLAHSVPETGTH